MRKIIGLTILFASFYSYSQTQDYKLGIKLGPSFASTYSKVEGTDTSITPDGTAVKFIFGAFADLAFKENYYFHTGFSFASKVTKVQASDPGFAGGTTISEGYDTQYLQIPFLLKLYTNEIILDTKLFVNFGFIPEILLGNSNHDPNNVLIEDFKSFDMSGNFGGGIERDIGVNTSVFVSINFYRGLLNHVQTQHRIFDDFKLKSKLISLEFGMKF